jgi:signal transduction histidine kinase
MRVTPRHLQRWRIPATTVLVWSAFALSPVALVFWPVFGGPPFGLAILIVALPLGVLRRRPLAVLGLLLGEMVLAQLLPLADFQAEIRFLQTVVMDLVVGHLAAIRRLRVSIGAVIAALAAQLTMALAFELWPGYGPSNAIFDILVVIIVWLAGNTIRVRRQYKQAREAQAIQAERLRIARELHDMVAHSIGVIAIQAGMGSRVIDTQPAEAGNALRAIEAASRDTLAGLRTMIGALRRSDGEPIAGQQGLGDLDDLVIRSVDAGVRVDVQWSGERRPLPPDIDLSAFRIIQEAVTNVVRHAGTDRCEVAVDQRDQELVIDVTDNGRGGVPGTGYGLRGMRERVALLRGDFTAEPRPEGGFRVTARIPIPAGVR